MTARGVLCLHGFTATPFEFHYLGTHLERAGFIVSAPLLPGHGGSAAELDRTSWRDWFFGAEAAFDALRARCDRVAVVGQSLGGLLALHLARMRGADVACVGSLGAPLWLPPVIAWAIRALAGASWFPDIPKRGGPDLRDRPMAREVAARGQTLGVFPPRALHSLEQLTRVVRAEVELIRTPTFVAHAAQDHVAPPACAAELARRVSTRDVKLLWLQRSYHILPLDVEKDLLAGELTRFLAERMPS